MTQKNCDDVKEYLENTYPILKNSTFVIHTNKEGRIEEGNSSKSQKDLEILSEKFELLGDIFKRVARSSFPAVSSNPAVSLSVFPFTVFFNALLSDVHTFSVLFSI